MAVIRGIVSAPSWEVLNSCASPLITHRFLVEGRKRVEQERFFTLDSRSPLAPEVAAPRHLLPEIMLLALHNSATGENLQAVISRKTRIGWLTYGEVTIRSTDLSWIGLDYDISETLVAAGFTSLQSLYRAGEEALICSLVSATSLSQLTDTSKRRSLARFSRVQYSLRRLGFPEVTQDFDRDRLEAMLDRAV